MRMRRVEEKMQRSQIAVHAESVDSATAVTEAMSISKLSGLVQACKTNGCDPAMISSLNNTIMQVINQTERNHETSKQHLEGLKK
jgi:hypothetical protein